MVLRALLVFLVVVNLGVAAWWALRAPAPPPRAVALPAGVPKLQLLAEAPRRVVSAPPRATPASAAATAQCASFGPYANPGVLRRAVSRLETGGMRARVREEAQGTPSGWRVFLPPQASPGAAQALADRIGAAGFDDYLVLGDGPERNAIALGRFGSEAAARRRVAALAKAGFEAQVAPLGNATRSTWLDVALAPGADAARIAQDIDAARTLPLDCARLR